MSDAAPAVLSETVRAVARPTIERPVLRSGLCLEAMAVLRGAGDRRLRETAFSERRCDPALGVVRTLLTGNLGTEHAIPEWTALVPMCDPARKGR